MSHTQYKDGDHVRILKEKHLLTGTAKDFAGSIVQITALHNGYYTAEPIAESEYLSAGESMIVYPNEIEGLVAITQQLFSAQQKMIVLTLSDFQVTEDDSITVRQLRQAESAANQWNAPRTSPSFFVDSTREGALRKAAAWWLINWHDVAGLLTGRISEIEWDMENPFPKSMLTSDERVTVGERS